MDPRLGPDLQSSIENHPDPTRICFVIDGLDEIDVERERAWLSLLVGQDSSYSYLVTTQPEQPAASWMRSVPTLTLTGFSEAGIHHYIDRFYGAETPDALKAWVCHQRALQDLIGIPLICHRICVAWKEGFGDEPTLTELYDKLIQPLSALFENEQGKTWLTILETLALPPVR